MSPNNYKEQQKLLQELLQQMRRHAGISQTDLANRLGKPQSYVSKYESGERRLDLIELRHICKTLGLSLTEFVRKFESSINDTK